MEGDFLDPFRWGVWIFILIGAAVLAAALYWANRRFSLLLGGARAPGVVVGRESSSGSGKTTYYPIVEFHTPDGHAHRMRGSTGSSGGAMRSGRKVTVVYDPADPTRGFINTFVQAWLGPVGVGIFGAAFLGFGLLALSALDMGEEMDVQVRAQQDKLRSRLETTREQTQEDEPDESDHKANVDVPTDLFAKPKH